MAHTKGKPVVLAPTGPLERDYDDVRRFADAAEAGMKRAIRAGAKLPTLLVQGAGELPVAHLYTKAEEVAALGALSCAFPRDAHSCCVCSAKSSLQSRAANHPLSPRALLTPSGRTASHW